MFRPVVIRLNSLLLSLRISLLLLYPLNLLLQLSFPVFTESRHFSDVDGCQLVHGEVFGALTHNGFGRHGEAHVFGSVDEGEDC